MAAFAAGAYRPLPGRGASPGFRFTLYAVLAIVLMFVDHRSHWLEHVRFVLSGAAYPLQLAVSSPSAAWRWLEESFATREALSAQNQALRETQHVLELKALRFEALARENAELRGLQQALPSVAERWLPAEVVDVTLDSLRQRQRVLIDRGTGNGVFQAQAVMDASGLVGQTLHVGPWSAEVILVTDPEHAVPVEIERTGLHTIAVGTGDAESLGLPYLPANADVKPGDLLVTSGLGGVFPHGYPVARVTEVRRDAVQPLAQIRAAPLARVDRLHEVMLVWFRADHPASPLPAAAGMSAKTGNPALQPARIARKLASPVAPPAVAATPVSPAVTGPGAATVGTTSAPAKPPKRKPPMPPAPPPEPPAEPASTAPPAQAEPAPAASSPDKPSDPNP